MTRHLSHFPVGNFAPSGRVPVPTPIVPYQERDSPLCWAAQEGLPEVMTWVL